MNERNSKKRIIKKVIWNRYLWTSKPSKYKKIFLSYIVFARESGDEDWFNLRATKYWMKRLWLTRDSK